jgi:hypothetical protein
MPVTASIPKAGNIGGWFISFFFDTSIPSTSSWWNTKVGSTILQPTSKNYENFSICKWQQSEAGLGLVLSGIIDPALRHVRRSRENSHQISRGRATDDRLAGGGR